MRAIFLGLLLASSIHCANAQAPSRGDGLAAARAPGLLELAQRTRAARIAGDHKGWLELGQKVLSLAPEHPDLLISVARALAANGRLDDALARLAEAVNRGAGFDVATFPEFQAASGNRQLNEIAARALRNREPVSPPDVFMALGNGNIEPEGITYDPVERHLYIGSLNGEIWQIDLEGRLERFAGADTGLREVLGLEVDPRRRLLWAVTGVFPDTLAGGEPKKDVGVTGVHAYRLDTRARMVQCVLDERPKMHGFNDLALASNGDVYVTDSIGGAVYRLPGGECKLERLFQDDTVTFPNGIVLDANQTRLYVAYIEGLSAMDLGTGKRMQLAVPSNGTVNSIDGLALHGATLLGIQGSPYLARVAEIHLSADGLAVREVKTLSARPPPGLNQTTGVVAGGYFYTVAGFPDALAGGEGKSIPHILRSRLPPRDAASGPD